MLPIFLQRTVHHDAIEAKAYGAHARRFVVAVILVQADRNGWILCLKSLDELCKDEIPRVRARTPAGLDDNRAIGLFGSLKNGNALLHIVDIERRNAITVFCCVIEKLP